MLDFKYFENPGVMLQTLFSKNQRSYQQVSFIEFSKSNVLIFHSTFLKIYFSSVLTSANNPTYSWNYLFILFYAINIFISSQFLFRIYLICF